MDSNGLRRGGVSSVSQFLVDLQLNGDGVESLTVRFNNQDDADAFCADVIEDPGLKLQSLTCTYQEVIVTIQTVRSHIETEEK